MAGMTVSLGSKVTGWVAANQPENELLKTLEPEANMVVKPMP